MAQGLVGPEVYEPSILRVRERTSFNSSGYAQQDEHSIPLLTLVQLSSSAEDYTE
jgi:hypothetical protein